LSRPGGESDSCVERSKAEVSDFTEKLRALASSAKGMVSREGGEHSRARAKSRKVEAIIRSALSQLKGHLRSPKKDAVAFLNEVGGQLEAIGESRLTLFEAACKAYPDDDDLCLRLADLYEKDHRHDEAARAVYELAMTLRPRHTAFRLRMARSLAQSGQEPQAVALLRRVLTDLGSPAFRPDDAPRELPSIRREAAMTLANIYAGQNRTDSQAIAAYRAALSAEPGHVELTLALGAAYADEQITTDEARMALGAALELRPDDARLNAAMARLEIETGQPDAASQRLQRLLLKTPGDQTLLKAMRELGVAPPPPPPEEEHIAPPPAQRPPAPAKEAKSGGFAVIQDFLRKNVTEEDQRLESIVPGEPDHMLILDASTPPTLAGMGAGQRETRYDAFERSLKEEVKVRDKSRLTVSALAQIVNQIIKSGDSSLQSIRFLREAISREPKNLAYRRAVVNACLRNGDVVAALREAVNLLRHAGNDRLSIELAARALVAVHATPSALEKSDAAADIASLGPEAAAVVRRGAELAPNNPALLRRAALILARQSQTRESDLAVCQRALDTGEFDYEVAQFLAGAYERQSRDKERLEILWKAFEAKAPRPLFHGEDERAAAQAEYRDDLLQTLAYELFNSKADDERAAQVYREFLSQRPGHPELTVFVARRFRDSERMLEQMGPVFRAAAELAPGDAALAVTAAKLAVREGRASDAQTLLEPFLPGPVGTPTRHAVSPETLDTILGLVCAAVESSNSLVAGLTAKLEALFLERSEDKNVILALAFAYIIEGRADAITVSVYEKARQLRPGDLRFPLLIAQCYSGLSANEEAMQAYREVLAQAPDDPATVAQMARFCTMTRASAAARGKASASEERIWQETYGVVKKALARHPGHPDVNLAYAQALHAEGHRDEAIARMRSAVTSNAGSRPRVIAALKDLARLAPEHVATHLLLAELLIAEGLPLEALEVARELYGVSSAPIGDLIDCLDRVQRSLAASASPAADPGDVAMEKAVLLKSVGMFRESLDELRHIALARPKDENVQQEYEEVLEIVCRSDKGETIQSELARHYLGVGQAPKAIALLQERLKTKPSSAAYRRWLGTAFMRVGNLDLAAREFARLEVDETLKPVLYDLAGEYARLRQYGLAIETIDRIRQVSPDYGDIGRLREFWVAQSAHATTGGLIGEALEMSGLNESARRRYELLEMLGRGAYGEVYKAFDHEFDEVVALKILPQEYQLDPAAVDRFRFEARAARRLTHRNIVRIHDIGEEEGRKYISMEFVDGSTLERKLIDSPKPPKEDVCRIVYQVALALRHAHSEGVIHRDVKPANVMINSQGVVKLTDFGVAALRSTKPALAEGEDAGDSFRTVASGGASGIVGTPLYMSPEQVRGQSADGRSDLYSLGVVIYEMLHGEPPFTSGRIAYRHAHEEPAPPQTSYSDIAAIALKCMKKTPEERFQSAGELIADLKRVAVQYGVQLEEE